MNVVKFLHVERRDGTLVVSLLKNVGCFSDDDFQDEWRRLLELVGDVAVRRVVVDFTRVAYFGSLVLELTLDLSRRLRDRDGRVVLCGLSAYGEEVVRTARFDRLCQLAPSLAEALGQRS
ncbi:MAG: STAS domain-containing protein [Pirellulales bacterium]